MVEDDENQVGLYRQALGQYRMIWARNGTEALQITKEEIPDVIILDHVLAQGERGTDFLPVLKTTLAHVPIVLVTGTLDLQGQLKALQGPFSAHYVVEKPVDIDELRRVIAQAIDECGLAEAVRSIRSLERAEMIRTSEPERQFSERLARHHEILRRLRAQSAKANVSLLARELKVSRRTISRDLLDLIHRGQLDPQFYSEAAD